MSGPIQLPNLFPKPTQVPAQQPPAVINEVAPLLAESEAVGKFEDDTLNGVYGFSKTHTGVVGESARDFGVKAFGPQAGLLAVSDGDGVFGTGQRGVVGTSRVSGGTGVFGDSHAGGAGVIGESPNGIGILGRNSALAGRFEGNVEITGDIRLLNAADCAEDFDIVGADSVEPGTVMVLSEGGELRESHQAYDKRVAGVISGAGDYKPGIVLDKQHTSANRRPIALLGKVYCKVDAQFGGIEVGDLLTTSPTPGHAMKTNDPFKAFGAVIGKALGSLQEGQALLPILVALQ